MNNKVIFILPVNLYICHDLIATNIPRDFWGSYFQLFSGEHLCLHIQIHPRFIMLKYATEKCSALMLLFSPAGKLPINLKIP